MRQAARTVTTATGNLLPWPTTNDTTVMGRRLGTNAVLNPAAVQNQNFGQVTFHAWTYTSDVIRIPNELLNDSAFDLAAEVRDRFAERIGRIQNSEFTTLAALPNGPTGVVTVANVGPGAAVNAITGDNITMSWFLDEGARPHASEFMRMLWAGAEWHRAGPLLIPKRRRLYPRPARRPELNLTEQLGDQLREKGLVKPRWACQEAVDGQVQPGWAALEQDHPKGAALAGLGWIQTISLPPK